MKRTLLILMLLTGFFSTVVAGFSPEREAERALKSVQLSQIPAPAPASLQGYVSQEMFAEPDQSPSIPIPGMNTEEGGHSTLDRSVGPSKVHTQLNRRASNSPPEEKRKRRSPLFSILSLLAGLVSFYLMLGTVANGLFFSGFMVATIVFAGLGIWFGVLGVKKKRSGKGLAIAGLILSGLSIFLPVAMYLVFWLPYR